MQEPPLDPNQELGLPPERLPRHIAIIMDGNGRWANLRRQPRIRGHVEGAANVRPIITHCARLNIDALTLYSFSTENWKRPKKEIDALMNLYAEYLVSERETIMNNDVKLTHIGRRKALPEKVLRELDITQDVSRNNTGLNLCLAIDYGARDEIIDAVRAIAEQIQQGKLQPADIDEPCVSRHLYTAGLPDPDLLIRTAGEMRISNFLLWQISYAELYVTDKLWPDFSKTDLNQAIQTFAARDRRFGAVKTDIQPHQSK